MMPVPESHNQFCELFWEFGSRCNFNCPYCISASNIYNTKEALPISQIVKSLNSTGKKWHIHISGGEPFLHPDFVELCTALTRYHKISVSTNLSTNNVVIFTEQIPQQQVGLVKASLHISERMKFVDGLKRFVDFVNLFQNRTFKIQVEYTLYPPLVHRVFRDLIYLNTQGVHTIRLKPFFGVYNNKKYPESYSNDLRNLLRRYAETPKGLDPFAHRESFGKICHAGINTFYMDASGNLRRCANSKVSYGNLFNNYFKADTSPRPCPFPTCTSIQGVHSCGAQRSTLSKILHEVFQEYPSILESKLKIRNLTKNLTRYGTRLKARQLPNFFMYGKN